MTVDKSCRLFDALQPLIKYMNVHTVYSKPTYRFIATENAYVVMYSKSNNVHLIFAEKYLFYNNC